MSDFKKLKCAVCNNEQISRAKIPVCGNCGSRKLNEVDEFSSLDSVKKKPEFSKPMSNPKPIKEVEQDDDDWSLI